MTDQGELTARPTARGRADYRWFLSLATRWMDNDVYGHVNNVQYYSFVDTVVNQFLVEVGGLDIHEGEAIGLAAESGCRYFEPLAFPATIDAGLRVTRLGTSSVTYEVGLFAADSDEAAAEAFFVHVFVDRRTRRPTPLPPNLRLALGSLVTDGG